MPPLPRLTLSSAPVDTKPMRLAKRIADAGVCSRRRAEDKIRAGVVVVNGVKVDTPAFTVTYEDKVEVEGVVIGQALPKVRMWMFHKPAGCLTTHADPRGRQTVFDLLPKDLPRVISIGRLDYNSEGLLLLTTNGEVSRYCSLPQTGWKRVYRVRAFGALPRDFIERAAAGLVIDGMHYEPVVIEAEGTKEYSRQQNQNRWFTVTLTEGKNREIRKIFEYFGLAVNRLLRTSYGPFNLGDLPRGAVREIPPKLIQNYIP